jgi:hypothetical protein
MGVKKESLTAEQKLEIEKLRQFVARRRLSPVMNSTKWRAALDAVLAVPGYAPSFRAKLVTDQAEPGVDAWNPQVPGGLPLYNAIEWLEFNSWSFGSAPKGAAPKDRGVPGKLPGYGEALREALKAAGIPLAESPTGVRITGYVKT